MEILQHRPIPIKYYKDRYGLGRTSGASGSVYGVQIDRQQFKFADVATSDDPVFNPNFAMKVVNKATNANRERDFLIAIGNVHHTNLTKCYSAFSYEGNYYMIYEKADHDLLKLMTTDKHPIQDENWLLRQMRD